SSIKQSLTSQERECNIDDKVIKDLAGIIKQEEMCVPLIIRPVNPTALLLLKARNADGKNMGVHGKSSVDSISGGWIPVNASISKAREEGNASKIAKANK